MCAAGAVSRTLFPSQKISPDKARQVQHRSSKLTTFSLSDLGLDKPMTISPYSEADDDKIFALTCARKNARTDVDAAAIAWAEEEIEALRRERDEAVSQLNQSYGERMLPGAPGPSPGPIRKGRTMTDEGPYRGTR